MKTFRRALLALFCTMVLVLSASCRPADTTATVTWEAPAAMPTDTPASASAAQAVTLVPETAATPTGTIVALAATSTPDGSQARAVILQALMAMNTRPNRMDSTTTTGDGKAHQTVIEFVPPDRKHILSLGDDVEYIIADGKVYARTPSGGGWAETEIPASTFLGDTSQAALEHSVSHEQFVRTDILDGKAVAVYNYESTTTSSGVELNSRTELWIGQSDGLPYKMVIDGQILSASLDESTGESKLQAVEALTTTRIEFGLALSIEPPGN